MQRKILQASAFRGPNPVLAADPAPTYCKVRVGAHVVSQALVVAIGVTADGTREVLGTAAGDSESFDFWREFLVSHMQV